MKLTPSEVQFIEVVLGTRIKFIQNLKQSTLNTYYVNNIVIKFKVLVLCRPVGQLFDWVSR